jgi:hypothetical protein
MSFGLYLIGYIILIVGLSMEPICCTSSKSGLRMIICLVGLAIIHGVRATRNGPAIVGHRQGWQREHSRRGNCGAVEASLEPRQGLWPPRHPAIRGLGAALASPPTAPEFPRLARHKPELPKPARCGPARTRRAIAITGRAWQQEACEHHEPLGPDQRSNQPPAIIESIIVVNSSARSVVKTRPRYSSGRTP